jgi:CO/xanthine dehydrogenase FAD-binding subunit
MKPAPFDYLRVNTLDDVCNSLSKNPNALIIAGGQSLLPMLSMRLARPSLIIDIANVRNFNKIEKKDDIINIGPMVRQSIAFKSSLLESNLPLLIKALEFVGHPSTRSRGTIGGSIVQADPSAEIPLVAVTLGATFHIRDGNENIDILASDFFLGPMITEMPTSGCLYNISFPISKSQKIGNGFHEIAPRKSDYAFASAAVQIESSYDGKIESISLGIGGAVDYPQLININEYNDKTINLKKIKELIEKAVLDIDFVGDFHASVEYRKRVVIELATRSFKDALIEIGHR